MIQRDPELTGVGLEILDEFHERSLQADLALALLLDAARAAGRSETVDYVRHWITGVCSRCCPMPTIGLAGRAFLLSGGISRWRAFAF